MFAGAAGSQVGVEAVAGIPWMRVGKPILCGVSKRYIPIPPVPVRSAEIFPPFRVFIDMPTDRVPDVTAETLRTVIGAAVLLLGNMLRGITTFCGPACVGRVVNELIEIEYHENPSVD